MITVVDLEGDNANMDSTNDQLDDNVGVVYHLKDLKRHQKLLQVRTGPSLEIAPVNTDNMQLYAGIISFFQFLGKFFGCEIRYSWKMYRYSAFWFACCLLVISAVLVSYTTYFYYKSSNTMKMLEPLALGGNWITLFMKWIVHLLYYKNIFSLIFAPKKLIRLNSIGVRADIINAGLKRTRLLLKLYTLGVFTVLSFSIILPIKYFVVDNIKLIIIPVRLPYIDQESNEGFWIAAVILVPFCCYNGLATTMFGSGFLISISNYIFHVDLIGQDFQDLSNMWRRPSETSVPYRHAFLVNICMKLQDLKWYMYNVKKVYHLKFFIYFIVSYLGQIICLYTITENNWIPGYTWALTIFIELSFYCWVGARLNIMDDKMCGYINSADWNLFDIKSQKMILMLLQQAQASNEIMLGPIGPLNMVTGITVVKGIYSYYTILTEML